MKTKSLVIAVCTASLLLPTFALAAKGDNKKNNDPAAVFASLDKDGNGSVSQAEYVEAMKEKLGEDGAKKHFAELDKNKDGSLTKDELGAATDKKAKRGKKKAKVE
jgi:hypothetical protein